MSQKIKKQIKRSIPLFLIFSLLWSSMAIGLVFNFDINFYKFSLDKPEALADTATTTVSVLNASPYFSVGPFEWPISSSTSPVNVGGNITFTAKANDPELDNYYLLVCAGATGQPNNGAAPTCSGQTFCVSGATATGASSTCTYVGVADPSAETDDWYAYVCDAHATEAACSAVNQGSGDSGSPFYVNHAPTIALVITSDNYKEPGGTFTVTASSTDSDVAGGADIIYFDICATNSWSADTHCAVQLCQATSSPAKVNSTASCQFTTDTVKADQNYTYYAYIQDWHSFAGTNNGTSTYYTVINVAPTVTSVLLNNGNDISPNLKNAPEYLATSTATVSDANGCGDLVQATSTIYWESVSGYENCTANDNNCYKITSVNCTQDVGTCIGASADYTCTTNIAFHAVPTDSFARYASSTVWRASLSIVDDNGAFGIATSVTGVDVETNSGLEVTESGIDYGTMNAGNDTGDNNATTTVVNYGNTPIDTYVQAEDDMLSGPYFILATQQEWSLNPFIWGSGTDLASSTQNLVDINIDRPLDQTDLTNDIYWGIGLPVSTHSGDYTGTTTFTVAIDTYGNW